MYNYYMTYPYPEIASLKNRLAKYELRYDELAKKCDKLRERNKESEEFNLSIFEKINRRFDLIEEQQDHVQEILERVLERLKTTELTVFPNLASDIRQLQSIIGEPVSRRDLDRRVPKKKPPKKP